MNSKALFFSACMTLLLLSCDAPMTDERSRPDNQPIQSESPMEETSSEAVTELKIENLLSDILELEDSIEVIMSMVEVPPNTTLPAHYHPGEEFIYLLEGSGILKLKGDSVMVVNAGDVAKVPLKKIHSFNTGEQHAKAVVFRVHEQGQPHRFLVDDEGDPHEH